MLEQNNQRCLERSILTFAAKLTSALSGSVPLHKNGKQKKLPGTFKNISIWNKTSIQRNQYMYLTEIIQFSKCLYCECLKPGSWQPPDLKWIVLVLFAHSLNATAMAGRERKNKVSPSPPGWWIHRATAPDCRSYQPSSVWETMESPTPTSQFNHYTASNFCARKLSKFFNALTL